MGPVLSIVGLSYLFFIVFFCAYFYIILPAFYHIEGSSLFRVYLICIVYQ